MTTRTHALLDYVCRQLGNFYPDGHDHRPALEAALPAALQRTDRCVSQVRAWASRPFDPMVSGQYASFLYFLSNEVGRHRGRDDPTAPRLFLLNKALHGLELFHDIALPDVFFLSHTPGAVFAKAGYGSHFVMHQGCTVGRKDETQRPLIGDRVVMYPNSMIIGSCRVGDETVLAPGVCLVDTDTPGHCYVLPGPNGRPLIKPARRQVWRDFFIG